MHQKQPAAAAGGKACGGLLQLSTEPAADAETQPGTAETSSSARFAPRRKSKGSRESVFSNWF